MTLLFLSYWVVFFFPFSLFSVQCLKCPIWTSIVKFAIVFGQTSYVKGCTW